MFQKISFLFGSGGLVAAAFLVFKFITKKEIFRFGIKTLNNQEIELPDGWYYYSLESTTDVSFLPEATYLQIKSKSGFTSTENKSHHVLITKNKVIAQLTICKDKLCTVNDPKLTIELLDGDAFLGYLFTWPDFRRRRAAQILIKMVENHMFNKGVNRIVTHIRATNVPSVAAFRRLGFTFPAYVISRLNGTFVGSVGMKKALLITNGVNKVKL